MPRPHGTYSIVAFDPATGEHRRRRAVALVLGRVDVSVGTARRRGGGDAVDRRAGPRTEHPRSPRRRLDATSALAAVLARDDVSAMRQVGVVDSRGRVAAHTGDGCIAEAGHVLGEHWACQANMMARADRSAGDVGGVRRRRRRPGGAPPGGVAGRGGRRRRRPRPAVGGARRRPGVGRALADAGQPARRGPHRSARRAGPAARPAARLRAGRLRATTSPAPDAPTKRRRCTAQAATLAPESDELLFWAGLALAHDGDLDWRRRRHPAGGGEASRLADAARSPLARDRPGGGDACGPYLSRIDSRNLLTTLMTARPAPRVDGT